MNKRTQFIQTIEQDIINFYLEGNTQAKCIEKFNISGGTVLRILRRNNISPRKAKEYERIPSKIQQEIIEFYLQGNSHYKIQNRFGTTRGSSLNILKKFNIKRRTFEEIHRIYSLQEDYFENIDTERKAYFLGLLVADGYNNNKAVTLSLQESDEHVLEILKEELQYASPIRTIERKQGCPNCKLLKSLNVNSKKLCKDLSKWGCIKNKSHHTYFPDIPENLWNHFIRGVFDGDGYIHKERKSFTIIGNRELILKIQDILCAKTGIDKNPIRVAHKCKENILELRYWKKSSILKIRDYMYQESTVYLQRKYNRFYDTNN